MILTTAERIILLDVLPKEGDYTTLKLVRKLRETLSFSEAEHKDLNFAAEGDKVRWDTRKDKPKDIHVGEKATDIIVECLKQLSSAKKLTDQHFSLYEKFIVEER